MDARTAGDETLNKQLVAVIEAARGNGDVAARFAHRLHGCRRPTISPRSRRRIARRRQRPSSSSCASASRARPAKLRIYDPAPDDARLNAGRHTVIEIVNDDMPFLVDFVDAWNSCKRELAAHLMAHPVMPVVRDAKGQITEFGRPGAWCCARVRHAHRDRPRRRGRRARRPWRRRCCARWARCGWAVADWFAHAPGGDRWHRRARHGVRPGRRRCAPLSRRPPRSCAGPRTTISPSWAAAASNMAAAGAAR